MKLSILILALAALLLTTADEYCTSPLQPIGGLVCPFVLSGVTGLVWWWARK